MAYFWREEEQAYLDALAVDPWQRPMILLEVIGLYRAATRPSARRYYLPERAIVEKLGHVPEVES